MITISNQHTGKKVRIRGIIPMPGSAPMLGQGDHVGVITYIEGRKFWFRDDGETKHDKSKCSFLSVGMWRIAEILT